MNPYKPEFMGSIAPFTDPSLMQDFIRNKYNAFSIIFASIKDQAEKIESISCSPLEIGSNTLSIEINTDSSTLEKIKEALTTATIFGNRITATQ